MRIWEGASSLPLTLDLLASIGVSVSDELPLYSDGF